MKYFLIIALVFGLSNAYADEAKTKKAEVKKPVATKKIEVKGEVKVVDEKTKVAESETKVKDDKATINIELHPKKDAEEVPDIGTIVTLFKEKNYRPAVAALIVLIIFLWRRYFGFLVINKIQQKHTAWVAALVGLVAALPKALMIDPFIWGQFILDGIILGGEAALFWSLLGKAILPKIFKEKTSGEGETKSEE